MAFFKFTDAILRGQGLIRTTNSSDSWQHTGRSSDIIAYRKAKP